MNRKKYSKRNRIFYTYIFIGCFVGFFGCAPKEIPKAIIPPAPKQTESIVPNIKKVDSGIGETIQSSNRIGSKLEESKKTIKDQDISISEAITQAEKLKEKVLSKTQISELETSNLIDQLKKVKSRNLFLEIQNQELTNLRTEQSKILDDLKNTLDKTKEQVINKENEVDQLRQQCEYLSKNLDSKNTENENLKKLLQKEKEVSASAKVYRNAIWGIVAIWVLLLILKNVWMSINPAARLRF